MKGMKGVRKEMKEIMKGMKGVRKEKYLVVMQEESG
jgi:hypothetical protein